LPAQTVDSVDVGRDLPQFWQRRLRRGGIGNTGERGAQVGDAVRNLLAKIEPADRQTRDGRYARLDHLLRRPEEVDEQGEDRQKRDEPIEPVARDRCRALTCIADGSSSGGGHPGCLARGSGCCPPYTPERIEQARSAK